MCRNSFRIAWMANHVDCATGNRGNHRFSVGGFILRREYRLMKTGNNQIQRGQHWSGTVNFTLGIFNIRFNAAQDADAIYQTRPDTHIDEMPVVRGIGHIRAVIGDGKKFNAFTFGLGNIVMQGTIGVGAGDGMHVQVNRIHHNLLLYLWQE